MTATTAVARKSFDDDALAAITTFQDAGTLLKTADVKVENAADYGTGFVVLKDKSTLVNVPFIIVEWAWHDSELFVTDDNEKGTFCSLVIVTRDDKKLIVNDGSTGISKQLQRVTRMRVDNGTDDVAARQGLYVAGGLVRSDYPTEDKAGNKITGTTYFLAD